MGASLSEQAYERIKTEILTCVLEPGQQIVQQQLAERYRVGKTPVREALQRLTQEGYVQPVPRFGYIVTPITLADIHEIYELRAVVEPAAARLAAMRCTDEQLEQIKKAADQTYVFNQRETYLEYLRHNQVFHYTIALVGGNRRLADIVAKSLEELARVFHLGLENRDLTQVMAQAHMPLLEALSDHDPDRAEAVMRSQISQSRAQFLETLTNHSNVDSHTIEIR
jgi:DNA-binding GntR family transcriptional regulator